MLNEEKIKYLQDIAFKLREDVIRMVSQAGSGHIAGPLDLAEIFSALYFEILNHNPQKPDWENRDRVIVSNGHICPVWYAVLARAGYFKKEELETFRQINSRLQGHPHRKSLPGIETTSGPLGSGLSQACGIALAAKLDNKKYRIYCIMSDAEQQEGNIWEAVMFAAKYKLSNITAIIDRNNIQISGFTEDVMPLEPLRQKYESFGWYVIEINGHDIFQIISACAEAKAIFEKPTLIIAHTIAGRGVDFMENDYSWHSRPFKPGEAEKALKQIANSRKRILGY
ncbi:MAG: transketolase [bacterium]|nr:transketolase [Patescibacteria group bacterium]MDW8279864.1 transketolase [bacterium]